MTRFLLLTAAVCAPASILFAGCGGAAPDALAPRTESAASDDLSTPEGAVAAVDRAERAIDQLFGPSQSFTISQQGGYAQAPAPPPPPPAASVAPVAPTEPQKALPPAEARPASTPSGGSKKSGPEQPHGNAADPCSTACTALASMERAADHLCMLAGAADDRCAGARTRVKSASARVHASCPTCSS